MSWALVQEGIKSVYMCRRKDIIAYMATKGKESVSSGKEHPQFWKDER